MFIRPLSTYSHGSPIWLYPGSPVPRPYRSPIKPECLGVGRTWVFLALSSSETNVQLNLRITDWSFCPPGPNTTSYPLLQKGDQRLLFPHGRAMETMAQGRQMTCCSDQKQNLKLPTREHSFPDSCTPTVCQPPGYPTTPNGEHTGRGPCCSTTV